MAKVERPLFCDEASGRYGMVLSFKKGAVWNSAIPQFCRRQSKSSLLLIQRNKFKAACAAWHLLSPAEHQEYSDTAPTGWTGFQYYMSQAL